MKTIFSVIVFILYTLISIGQEKEVCVTGRILEEVSNTPIYFASIKVMGDSYGTVSDENGYFEITLKSDSTNLIISHIAYNTDTIKIKKSNSNTVTLQLSLKTHEIGGVSIYSSNNPITIIRFDSIDIIDFEIYNNKLLFVGINRFDGKKQILGLAALNGNILSYREINNAGGLINPGSNDYKVDYLFRDVFKEVQLVTKTRVWQVWLENDNIYLIHPEPIDKCREFFFPMKCNINENLFFQVSNCNYNDTYLIQPGASKAKLINTVYDEFGHMRSLKKKGVKAPLITLNKQLLLFDYFKNKILFLSESGEIIKEVPTLFHTFMYYDALGKKSYAINSRRFTEQILFDDTTNRVFSLWKAPLSKTVVLKELDVNSGSNLRDITIQDIAAVDNVKVFNDEIFFIGKSREQRNHEILSMKIR